VATAAAVAFLESTCTREIEKWEMMAEKSFEFLETNIAKVLDNGTYLFLCCFFFLVS
jgi:hypothetical protein